jgi:hypothetical protein
LVDLVKELIDYGSKHRNYLYLFPFLFPKARIFANGVVEAEEAKVLVAEL